MISSVSKPVNRASQPVLCTGVRLECASATVPASEGLSSSAVDRSWRDLTDFPISNKVLVATFADDTAILASHEDPSTASENLQNELKETEDWLTKWRIQASENKSVHVTFGTRIENCPPVTKLNEEEKELVGSLVEKKLPMKDALEGMVNGRRVRGRRKYQLIDNIKIYGSYEKTKRNAENSKEWRKLGLQ
ncbi:hypothetical protein ANN_20259 [Periplaneta americana]|uniref:Reverse transcriptase domain-containing protein n=1 Tax=Periplaneta americana TaxID=6978 RepID=A0ABQ8SCU6_PERAM|nr:hypothetical protein ANN_20259 [Periplaneta americana]